LQSLLKDKDLACHLIVAAKPASAPTSERGIPVRGVASKGLTRE